MGVPLNGWFIRDNRMEMDDLVVPLFQETSITMKIRGVKHDQRLSLTRIGLVQGKICWTRCVFPPYVGVSWMYCRFSQTKKV